MKNHSPMGEVYEKVLYLFSHFKEVFYLSIDGEVKSYNYHICLISMKNPSPMGKVFEKVSHFIFFNVFFTIILFLKNNLPFYIHFLFGVC